MWKVKSREELIVSRKEAEEFWKFNVYKAQRAINQRHLDQIKHALKDDTFRTGSIAIVILKNEQNKKIKLLVNGQHQLRAIIDLDSMMIANLEEIECDTWEDVAEVYATYDQGGRGLYDLVNPYADAHDIKWPIQLTQKILGGGLYKDGRTGWDRQRKAASIHEYLKLGDFVFSIFCLNGKIDWKECSHLARRSVVAAMMMTAEKNREAARKFWIDVRDGEVKKAEPARTLRDFLIGYSIDHGRGSQYSKKATEREVFRKCLVAWNAFRKRTTTALKVYNDSIPKIEK
jgi:hypothetical protein